SCFMTLQRLQSSPPFPTRRSSDLQGGTVGGNVLTDGTADVFGADGPTVPAGGVVGVAHSSDVSAPVSGQVGTQIDGTYGKLTLRSEEHTSELQSRRAVLCRRPLEK